MTWALRAGFAGFGLLGLVLLIVTLLADPAGDDAADTVLPPSEAEELAHDALPAPESLPGGTWLISREDGIPPQATADTPACRLLGSREALFTSSDGHGSREYTRDTGDIPALIEVWVTVFETGTQAEQNVNSLDQLLDAGDYDDCSRDILSGAVGEAIVRIDRVPSRVTVTGETTQRSFNLVIEAGDDEVVLHYERYSWRYFNAAISVTVRGAVEDVDEETVRAAIESTQAAVERLAVDE